MIYSITYNKRERERERKYIYEQCTLTYTHTHGHTQDATDVFAAFHAGATTQYLKEFEIGEVDYFGTKDKNLVFFLFIHLRSTSGRLRLGR
jgi:hypothetical protein